MCAAYPLSSFDTIDVHTGELDAKSALNLIVFGVSVLYYLGDVTIMKGYILHRLDLALSFLTVCTVKIGDFE